jgi:histidinol dehydrogenase
MKFFNWENSANIQTALLQRAPNVIGKNITDEVQKIFYDIKKNKDEALLGYAKELDKFSENTFEIPNEFILDKSITIDPSIKDAIDNAWRNIYKFHEEQLTKNIEVEIEDGITCGNLVLPIQSIGLYIPAGSAPLISTAIMLTVPAVIAKIPNIALFTPCSSFENIHPGIYYIASKYKNIRMFGIGGPQAIAAMALGTQQIPKVDKIYGPGNAYVTQAKRLALTETLTAIDMPAGPSEVMVLADESSDIEYIASDLLSQCEHGIDSQAVLITTSKYIYENIEKTINEQVKILNRSTIIYQALGNSYCILVKNKMDIYKIINDYAPEHLILNVDQPRELLSGIKNAGSIFLGPFTPETAGDYCSGTNHVLPTYGYANSYSGLSVLDFQKRIQYQEISREGLNKLKSSITVLTKAEGLDAHLNAVTVRLGNDEI